MKFDQIYSVPTKQHQNVRDGIAIISFAVFQMTILIKRYILSIFTTNRNWKTIAMFESLYFIQTWKKYDSSDGGNVCAYFVNSVKQCYFSRHETRDQIYL